MKMYKEQIQTRNSIEQLSNIEQTSLENKLLPETISVNNLKNNKISIKAPDQVNEILNRIHNIQANAIKNTETQEETSSQNDRLVSDTTISDKKKNRKKANISII